MTENVASKLVSNDKGWCEFRLIFSNADSVRNWHMENYEFIKAYLIPLIRRTAVENFQILNYYNPSKGEDLIRFRVEAEDKLLKQIRNEINKLKEAGLLRDFESEDYSPQRDAERRLESVRQNLERRLGKPLNKDWKIAGVKDNEWVIDTFEVEAYSKKCAAFEAFLARVLGKWTRVFIEEMDTKPEDRWLVSLFIHLLINSLAYPGPNLGTAEDEIRKMPPL